MPDQPPRFAARSRIIRDEIIPHGAARLYLLLDDIGWSGQCVIRQNVLADFLGSDVRTVRRWLDALVRAGYLVEDRQRLSNRYVLGWSADRTPVSDLVGHQIGHPCPPDRTSMSAPSLEAEKQNTPPTPSCKKCQGRGLFSQIVRGYQVTNFCTCEAGQKQRLVS